MLAGQGIGSAGALQGRQPGGQKAEQERACRWVEEGSVFGGHWRALLHSPWGL